MDEPLGRLNWPLSDEFLRDYANGRGLSTVCLTFDHDWAPDYMVEHVLGLLARHGMTATFLATGASAPLVDTAEAAGHEVGLHINLAANSTQGGSLDEIIARLRAVYPRAVGNRFHLLGHTYHSLTTLGAAGFAYDLSRLHFNGAWHLPAFHHDNGMTLLAYSWEDGFNLGDGRLPIDRDAVDLASPGVKILNFHPINVFLNLANEREKRAFQRDAQAAGGQTEQLARAHRKSGRGVETLLCQLLDEFAQGGVRVIPVIRLVEAFRAAVAPSVAPLRTPIGSPPPSVACFTVGRE